MDGWHVLNILACSTIVVAAISELHALQGVHSPAGIACRYGMGGLIIGAGLDLLATLKGAPVHLDSYVLIIRCSLAFLLVVRWAGREQWFGNLLRSTPGEHGWGL